jgi:hypothetical protein
MEYSVKGIFKSKSLNVDRSLISVWSIAEGLQTELKPTRQQIQFSSADRPFLAAM